MTGLVFKWILKNGGIEVFHENNTKKSELLYKTIESSEGFFKPIVNPGSRSRVNVVFRVGNDDVMEKKFVEEAKQQGLHGLSGHRYISVLLSIIYYLFHLKRFFFIVMRTKNVLKKF